MSVLGQYSQSVQLNHQLNQGWRQGIHDFKLSALTAQRDSGNFNLPCYLDTVPDIPSAQITPTQTCQSTALLAAARSFASNQPTMASNHPAHVAMQQQLNVSTPSAQVTSLSATLDVSVGHHQQEKLSNATLPQQATSLLKSHQCDQHHADKAEYDTPYKRYQTPQQQFQSQLPFYRHARQDGGYYSNPNFQQLQQRQEYQHRPSYPNEEYYWGPPNRESWRGYSPNDDYYGPTTASSSRQHHPWPERYQQDMGRQQFYEPCPRNSDIQSHQRDNYWYPPRPQQPAIYLNPNKYQEHKNSTTRYESPNVSGRPEVRSHLQEQYEYDKVQFIK